KSNVILVSSWNKIMMVRESGPSSLTVILSTVLTHGDTRLTANVARRGLLLSFWEGVHPVHLRSARSARLQLPRCCRCRLKVRREPCYRPRGLWGCGPQAHQSYKCRLANLRERCHVRSRLRGT